MKIQANHVNQSTDFGDQIASVLGCSWLATKWQNVDLSLLLWGARKVEVTFGVSDSLPHFKAKSMRAVVRTSIAFSVELSRTDLPWTQLAFSTSRHSVLVGMGQGVCIYLLVGLTGAFAYGADIRSVAEFLSSNQ